MLDAFSADFVRSAIYDWFLDALMAALFASVVVFFVLLLILVFAACWQMMRESRNKARILERLRREATHVE